jgi:predicted DCC family thiol-disulfide oxidoreductase YuxK
MTFANPRWTVLYDPDCGFCKWTMTLVLARDPEHRLRPLALGTPEADDLLSDLTPEQRMASWHLIDPDGERISAGAAAAPLLRALGRGEPLARLLEAFPRVTERSYRWVADHRSQLSRLIPSSAKRGAGAKISLHAELSR